MGLLDAPGYSKAQAIADRAYSPATRPWFLDLAWEFFLGRYFLGDARNLTTLSSASNINATTYNITNAADLAVGNLVAVGVGNSMETVTVEAIVGTAITCHPRAKFAHAAGEAFGEVWADASHPVTTHGYAALAAFIANAKRRVSVSGTPVLFQEDFSTYGTDANAKANCPVGWQSFGTFASLTLGINNWAPGDRHPAHRRGNGTASAVPASSIVTTATGALTGIGTLASISVVPGTPLVVSGNLRSASTDYPSMWVINKTTGATIAGPVQVGAFTDGLSGFKNLGRRSLLSFTTPAGCTDIEVRLGNPVASGQTTGYMDDVRVQVGRQNSPDDRFVIEDPGSNAIVCLADSWGVQGGSGAVGPLKTALETRFGRTINVLGAGIGGERLDQMNARFATDVLPYRPAYVVHLSGFANDISQNRGQANIQADVDTFIALCRANGAVPVILGAGPTTNGTFSVTGSLNVNDWVRDRCDLIVI